MATGGTMPRPPPMSSSTIPMSNFNYPPYNFNSELKQESFDLLRNSQESPKHDYAAFLNSVSFNFPWNMSQSKTNKNSVYEKNIKNFGVEATNNNNDTNHKNDDINLKCLYADRLSDVGLKLKKTKFGTFSNANDTSHFIDAFLTNQNQTLSTNDDSHLGMDGPTKDDWNRCPILNFSDPNCQSIPNQSSSSSSSSFCSTSTTQSISSTSNLTNRLLSIVNCL